MKLLAHRTGADIAPPNSLAGFKKCLQEGADGIECDITFIKGEPFVWLKGMEKFLKEPIGELSDLDLETINNLRRKDCGEKILTVEDIFDFLSQVRIPVKIYFDVKYYKEDSGGQFGHISDSLLEMANQKIIMPAIKKGLADKIGFVTFKGGKKLLELAKKTDKRISTNLIVLFPWTRLEPYLICLDSISIGWKHLNHWRILGGSKKLVSQAKKFGLEVYGGITNTQQGAEWLFLRDFDGVWTNDPVKIKKTLQFDFDADEKPEKVPETDVRTIQGKRRILITGSCGYLAAQLTAKLKADQRVEKIIGIDIKEKDDQDEKYFHIKMSVTDPLLFDRLKNENFDTIIHAAWTFNPTHNFATQDYLDIGGTLNILDIAVKKNIKNFVYLGSTTCYAPLPENPPSPPFLKESDWQKNSDKRKKTRYGYSRNKAIVDEIMQNFSHHNPKINVFWIRGAIVLGSKTNNIVSYVAKSPFTFGKFMFRVAGFNPPMQFISEYDIIEILYLATVNEWKGVVNAAGNGVLKYSEIVKILDRREIALPAWILYPFVEILWRLRLFKFPSSLIDLIRYPWVGDIARLKKQFKYIPAFSSKEALEQFADVLN